MSKKKTIDKSNPENMKKETELWEKKYEHIACTDEAGRGPFAGPVVAAAVIMPKHVKIDRLTDSKKMSKKEHKYFSDQVKQQALSYAIGVVSVKEIDEIDNIKKAARLAMKRAIEQLDTVPDYLLIDGTEVVDLPIPQEYIIKGDYNCHGISAAAIIAKVHRDELMAELDEQYGGIYGWKNNAGYQTEGHVEACKKHGLTEHHRRTWRKTMALFDEKNV